MFDDDLEPSTRTCINCGAPRAVQGLCPACAGDAAEHAALAAPSLPTCIACGYVASLDYVALADACPRCGASPFIEATVQVTR